MLRGRGARIPRSNPLCPRRMVGSIVRVRTALAPAGAPQHSMARGRRAQGYGKHLLAAIDWRSTPHHHPWFLPT